MRIVTLNTWKNEGDYSRRLGLMSVGLAALAPDVVCLQECFAAEGDDTAAALARATGLRATIRPARRKLRPQGTRQVVSTSGLAILARWPSRDASLSLPTDPRDGERIAQRRDIGGADSALRILNLHLTHLRGADAADLRGRQLREALDWAMEGWTGALVVAGDFNAPWDAPELAPLARIAAEPDRPEAAYPVRSTLQGQAVDRPAVGPAVIDHAALIDPEGAWRVRRRFLALDRADAIGRFPSDHAAVVVDLEPAVIE